MKRCVSPVRTDGASRMSPKLRWLLLWFSDAGASRKKPSTRELRTKASKDRNREQHRINLSASRQALDLNAQLPCRSHRGRKIELGRQGLPTGFGCFSFSA